MPAASRSDHPISITPARGRVRVRLAGEVIADAGDALDLKESTYPVVHYIPRNSVQMDRLVRTDLSTHCPYKGDASYFSIIAKDGTRVENAVWSYETPLPEVTAIAGHLAFYPNKVEISEG